MNKASARIPLQAPNIAPARLRRTPHPARYGQQVGWLVLVASLLRLPLAALLELGTDESYYWLYTRHLQWNYFDHPPMVALWGWLFTATGLLQQELFVRLGSLVAAGLSTWFIYRATAVLYSRQAGWYAAVLYNCSLYAGLVAGLLIMPDTPQMVCWTFSLWMFALVVVKGGQWRHWLLFGLGAGLCIMSKVHGVFLWGGAGLYLVLHQRSWLLRWQPYAALLLTLLVASPILFWNIANDFATYRFHSQRVITKGWGLNLQSFFTELAGQVAFNNPVNVLLVLTALTLGGRQLRRLMPRLSFLLYTGLPLAALLLYMALFRTVYPHWSGPAYVSLLPVGAIYLARRPQGGWWPLWLRLGATLTLLFMIGWPLFTTQYQGTWGSRQPLQLGRGDITLDRYGWRDAGRLFQQYYAGELQKGRIAAQTPLVVPTWWGAHVEYYFGNKGKIPVLGLAGLGQIHHYQWTNALRQELANPELAFCIVPSDEYYNPAQVFASYYRHALPLMRISLRRGGITVRHFYVFKLWGWKGKLPVSPVQRRSSQPR